MSNLHRKESEMHKALSGTQNASDSTDVLDPQSSMDSPDLGWAEKLASLSASGAGHFSNKEFEAAETLYQQVLDICKKFKGPNDIDTISSMVNLGEALLCQKKHEDSAKVFRRGLKQSQEVLGPEHKTTLFRNQGEYAGAEEMYRRALETNGLSLNSNDSSMKGTMEGLAEVLWVQGKAEEGRKMWKQASGKDKEGEEDDDTASKSGQSKDEEQEQMYRHVLESIEKPFGEEHWMTLNTVRNLASVLAAQGKYEEAEQMYRRALQGFEKTFGKENRETLLSVKFLGLVLRDQSKYEEAEKMLRRALVGYENELGEEHLDTLRIVYNLGSVLEAQKRYEEVERIYRRALEGIVYNLGSVLEAQKNHEDAKQMYWRALRGYEDVFGKEHPETLRITNELGLMMWGSQANGKEAEQMFRRALEGSAKAFGKDHLDTFKSIINLGMVLMIRGEHDESEQMFRRALEETEKVLGKEHPLTLTSAYTLARLLRIREDYIRAADLYEWACSGNSKLHGPDHEITKQCMAEYSSLRELMARGDV
ncbi:uncharacterized protein Z519_09271 [Cladophialophora bantiana CBS 173.52]|uniref:MalT-like TPR region domain-containing protein n=1 Tax=Cladophialophora bantiana (strain ATCC 10958 / CBS 173.52 / CDC B-1940 / NIH 8579) TaxID=1442370 RepID=A0A0D2FTG6_CLAB1|nr:uncharacterized protein Z519_09271 [Cladophialophora bantiana CBS 173.52]KIW89842.1 hypothetical protein Z519_09271 [Cladophialophora bantiana CBS 173.52]